MKKSTKHTVHPPLPSGPTTEPAPLLPSTPPKAKTCKYCYHTDPHRAYCFESKGQLHDEDIRRLIDLMAQYWMLMQNIKEDVEKRGKIDPKNIVIMCDVLNQTTLQDIGIFIGQAETYYATEQIAERNKNK